MCITHDWNIVILYTLYVCFDNHICNGSSIVYTPVWVRVYDTDIVTVYESPGQRYEVSDWLFQDEIDEVVRTRHWTQTVLCASNRDTCCCHRRYHRRRRLQRVTVVI